MVLYCSFSSFHIYACNNCGKKYKYKRNLNAHQRYECGKEPQLFCYVDGCNYVAKLKAHLKILYEKGRYVLQNSENYENFKNVCNNIYFIL
nr:unnamed protein product [Callosobruchus analis]